LLEDRAAAAEGFDGSLRLPALEDVDAAGVDQVGGDDDVEAAGCPVCLFDDDHAARKVGLALLGLDRDVSCNDDHGPLLFIARSSAWGRRTYDRGAAPDSSVNAGGFGTYRCRPRPRATNQKLD
jgi:hypothetical protein